MIAAVMQRGLAGMAVAIGACSLTVNPPAGFQCEPDDTCPAGQVCQNSVCVPAATCLTAIAAGDGHSCAIRNDGTAWCWGANASGQLGDGTSVDRAVPVAVLGAQLPKFTAITGGREHTCALGSDGSVWCWGSNDAGQLGHGMNDSATPVAVSNLSDAIEIASGVAHTCAIHGTDRSVVCWGLNDAGELGNGTTISSPSPSPIDGLHGVTAIAAGGESTCAVDGTQQLWCWGDNQAGQLGDPKRGVHRTPIQVALPEVVGVAVGAEFSCALRSGGQVTCLGSNERGQLGAVVDSSVLHPAGVAVAFTGVAKSIVARNDFACLTDDHQRVWCWGNNWAGQLASSRRDDLFVPVLASYGDAKAVVTGGDHTCALSPEAVVRCGRYNGRAQDGNGGHPSRQIPQVVPEVHGAVSVTAGSVHTCATLQDGTVTCWGGNEDGQLGDGMSTSRGDPAPVSGLTGVQMLASGFDHSCALISGAVQCWGSNGNGQLGDDTFYSRGSPLPVPGLMGNVEQIAAGGNISCALIGGAVWCWGQFQAPDNSGDDAGTPVNKAMLAGVRSIAIGDGHACVINGNRSLACWGLNDSGQLGNGNNTTGGTPVAVVNLSGADQVAAGDEFTCAHVVPDAVWCWGRGDDGQLGIGDFDSFNTPQRVISLTGTKKLAAGGTHACAITSSGALMCWGASFSGEVGDGGYGDRIRPVAVAMPGNASVLDVAAGEEHTCAVLADGTVACWGDNRSGQLGGDILTDLAPVAPKLSCP